MWQAPCTLSIALLPFRTDWEQFYKNGGIIIADRYTTSNMVHQMVKYDDQKERTAFLDWLEDFEFNKFVLAYT